MGPYRPDMAASWTIRPARTEDAAGIARVARRTWHAAYDAILGPATVEQAVARYYRPASLEVEIDDAAHFLVAEADDAVVGYAHAGPRDGTPGVAELYRLYVRPERWDDGIGSALLERVVDEVRTDGLERVRLDVLAANDRAIGFYRDRGFEPAGRTAGTFGDDEYDELVLARRVSTADRD